LSKLGIVCAVIVAIGMPLTSFGAVAGKPPPPPPPANAWMVLYYICDEGDLSGWGIYDVERELLEAVHTNVKTLVMIDPGAVWEVTGTANAWYVDVGWHSLTPMEDLGEVSMGAPASLSNFVIWARTTYGPASHYALVLQDHGGGWQGVCWDNVPSSGDFLSLAELHSALDTVKTSTGIVFDVIGFDGCEMAYTEVAYQIKDHAQVMVASQDVGWFYGPGESPTGNPPEGTGGWPNYWVITHLSAVSSTTDAVGFATIIVNDWKDFWEHYQPLDTWPSYADHFLTISAVRLGSTYGMTNLNTALGNFAQCLKDRIPTYETQIWASRDLAAGFGSTHDIDLYNFVDLVDARNMGETAQMRSAMKGIRDSITKMVCAEWHEPNHRIAHGLNIFFPSTFGMYTLAKLRQYSLTDFGKSSGGANWDSFIKNMVRLTMVQTAYDPATGAWDGTATLLDSAHVRIVGATVVLQYSTDGGVTWMNTNQGSSVTDSFGKALMHTTGPVGMLLRVTYATESLASNVVTVLHRITLTLAQTSYDLATGAWDGTATLLNSALAPIVGVPVALQYSTDGGATWMNSNQGSIVTDSSGIAPMHATGPVGMMLIASCQLGYYVSNVVTTA